MGKIQIASGSDLWYKAKKRLLRIRYDYVCYFLYVCNCICTYIVVKALP